MLHWKTTSQAEIAPLRAAYLAQLPQAQEWFCEQQSQAASVLGLTDGQRWLGYCLYSGSTLVAWYLDASQQAQATAHFAEALRSQSLTQALCQSFDAPLLALCLSQGAPYRVNALLYRDWQAPSVSATPPLTARLAQAADLAEVMLLNDAFFEGPEEAAGYLARQELLLYTLPDGESVGCGIFQRVTPAQQAWDIGMVVSPAQRRKGYGTAIIAHLRTWCQARGWEPICGCSADNLGSQRCLEAAGFVSHYRLLHFSGLESG
ncbi:MAG: GNAT family N-acetyltransferase [Candidatus Sericytochromatia bacterium]